MKGAWRRFRQLPGATQAAVWFLIAAAYTIGLIAVLGGDDDGDQRAAKAPRKLTSFERDVARAVTDIDIKASEKSDVVEFRRPRVRTVRCEGVNCTVDYEIGLPGRGRILEDQGKMWQRLFVETTIQSATLRVYRAATVGRNTPPKPTEETIPGQAILTSKCSRADAPPNYNWRGVDAPRLTRRICDNDFYDAAGSGDSGPGGPASPGNAPADVGGGGEG